MRVVAYIGDLNTFVDNRYHKRGGEFAKYVCVQTKEDVAGKFYDDYIIADNAYLLPEYFDVLKYVQDHLRKPRKRKPYGKKV